jgi:hypothetical protein
MDLAEFVKARLDEDEALTMGLRNATRIIGGKPDFYGVGGPAAMGFWGHFDPARVLREVEAKWKILTWWENELRGFRSPGARERASRSLPGFAVIFTLAAVWRDHPDYDPAWSPS